VVTFLNMVEAEKFAEHMDNAETKDGKKCFNRKDGEDGKPLYWEVPELGAKVFHEHGDPGNEDALVKVMKPREPNWKKFDVVIVLATSAKDIPKTSQDARMLSTYILVHQVHKEINGDDYLHIISENNFDTTATLAESVAVKDSVKDLVNTRAIYARGLVQALSFPKLQPAVTQLFHQAPDLPMLRCCEVGKGLIPVGRHTFGDISRTVIEHPKLVGCICIGYATEAGVCELAPHPDDEREYKQGDLLVLIDRYFKPELKAGSRANWDAPKPTQQSLCGSVPVGESKDEARALLPATAE